MADDGNTGDETPLIMGAQDMSYGSTINPSSRRLGYQLMEEIRPCLAEFLGVTLFVFLGTTSALSGNVVSSAMAHGLTIMLLIIAFGDISGGHFNPCVTLGALMGGDITFTRTLFYWIAQLLGSILGAAFNKGVLPEADYLSIGGGIPELRYDVTVAGGILCEATLTFLLVEIVLMTAVDRKDNILAPVAIGLVVAVDISAAANVSGAVMNPARAFGPAVVGSSVFHAGAWTHQYIYWVGPVAGALVAGTVYRLLLASPHKRLFWRG